MGDVWVGRHGHTTYNTQSGVSEELARGWQNIPLDDVGRREAMILAGAMSFYVKKPPRQIWSSDLIRAAETAEEVAEVLGCRMKITKSLRTWNLGDFQGYSLHDVQPMILDYIFKTPEVPVPGGESFHDFQDRLLDFVDQRLREAEDSYSDLVIITHNSPLKMIQAYLAGLRRKVVLPVYLSRDLNRTGTLMRVLRASGGWTYQMIQLNPPEMLEPDDGQLTRPLQPGKPTRPGAPNSQDSDGSIRPGQLPDPGVRQGQTG